MNLSKVVLDAISAEIGKIHTMLPARIVAIDGNDVDVQPLIYVPQGGKFRKLPILPAVPFFSFGFGNTGLFIRPEVGMDCFVLCNESSLDNYLESRDYAIADSTRRFDLTDAVVIAGVTDYTESSNPVSLRTKEGSVDISDSGDVVLNEGVNHAVSYEELAIAFNTLKAEFDSVASVVGKPPSLADISNSKVDKVRL